MRTLRPIPMLIIMAAALQLSCRSAKDNNTKHQRSLLVNYIRDEFALQPSPGDLYILIPKITCRGCVVYKLQTLLERMERDTVSNIRIITGNMGLIPEGLKGTLPILEDK